MLHRGLRAANINCSLTINGRLVPGDISQRGNFAADYGGVPESPHPNGQPMSPLIDLVPCRSPVKPSGVRP